VKPVSSSATEPGAHEIQRAEFRSGIFYAASAYALWGVFPLYFKALGGVNPFELVIHRVVWSAVFLALVLAVRRRWSWLPQVFTPRVLGSFVASGLVLAINWLVYIWAVSINRIVDGSLGYFINPLVSVLLGVLLLGERLRRFQWFAISVAALGVLWLTWQSGRLPWIGLVVALSFGMYGFLRKTAALGALEGLALETALLLPFALAYLGFAAPATGGDFMSLGLKVQLLICTLGPVTAVPLLLFAAGARRIPLSLMGVIQYIAPTLQLGLGVLVYHEPFKLDKLIGFGLIWAALALYSLEGYWVRSQRLAT
jgi:chloramphenicol-sensitive protein RarD